MPTQEWIKAIANIQVENYSQQTVLRLTINGIDVEIPDYQKETLLINGALSIRARSKFLDTVPEFRLKTGETVYGCTNDSRIFQTWLDKVYKPNSRLPYINKAIIDLGYSLPKPVEAIA